MYQWKEVQLAHRLHLKQFNRKISVSFLLRILLQVVAVVVIEINKRRRYYLCNKFAYNDVDNIINRLIHLHVATDFTDRNKNQKKKMQNIC